MIDIRLISYYVYLWFFGYLTGKEVSTQQLFRLFGRV